MKSKTLAPILSLTLLINPFIRRLWESNGRKFLKDSVTRQKRLNHVKMKVWEHAKRTFCGTFIASHCQCGILPSAMSIT